MTTMSISATVDDIRGGSAVSVRLSHFFFLSATAEYVRMVSVMRPGTVTVMMVGPLYAQSCC